MKRTIIYLTLNYLILAICWGIMDMGLIFSDSNFLQMITIAAALINCAFCIGVDGIIYCIFTIKEKDKNIAIMLAISIIINILLMTFDSGLFYILRYITINQICGVIIGKTIQIIKSKKKIMNKDA